MTVFSPWIAWKCSEGYEMLQKLENLVRDIALWECPIKWHFFRPFWKKKKKKIQWRFICWRSHHRKNLMENFCDAVSSRFRISNWFLKIHLGISWSRPRFSGFLNSNFLPFSEFSRTLFRKAKKDFPHSSYSTKTKWGTFLYQNQGSSMKPLGQVSAQTHKLLFQKKQKTSDFLICNDVISCYFYFYQNYIIAFH